MATKKPMKKSRRYDVGGEVATDEPMTRRITFNNDGTRTQSFGEQVASRQKMGGDESALKQKGLEVSNKDAKPSGFLDSIKSTFSRFGEGSIDTPGSEAYNKYGAGRARAAAPVPVANQLTPRKVSIGDAEYEDERAKRRAMERSRVMQQDISAGTDFVDRPQDEGYRPYVSPRDRAVAEGEKDSGKIIENTGSRTKPSKPAIVTKEQMAKEGFDNLRDYLNAKQGLKRRKEKEPTPKLIDAKNIRSGAGMKSGGSVSSASRRADGIATKGKTRGKIC